MPAKAYRYYRVESFPSLGIGESLRTQHQFTLLREHVDETAHTELKYLGLAELDSFHKYHVIHEMQENVRGRYRNEPIYEYIAEVRFHLYYEPKREILFADTRGPICREFIRRFRGSKVDMSLTAGRVDLVKLAMDMKSKLTGGWFGKLRVADVSAIGLFGPHVGESNEWDKYSELGELSSIDVIFEYEGTLQGVKITKDRTIVFYRPLTEFHALTLLEQIQTELDRYVPQAEGASSAASSTNTDEAR